MLSLSKHERTLQPFQSLPFDRLPSTSSGQAKRVDWKVGSGNSKRLKIA
ncbi:MAG: hypothetical protein LBD67_02240 [Candidatus Accumulibacter sp.]|nr:hypothetical protein [Accumulibacter sp.]